MEFKRPVEEKLEIMIMELPLAGLYTVLVKVRQIAHEAKINHSATNPERDSPPQKHYFWEQVLLSQYPIIL